MRQDFEGRICGTAQDLQHAEFPSSSLANAFKANAKSKCCAADRCFLYANQKSFFNGGVLSLFCS